MNVMKLCTGVIKTIVAERCSETHLGCLRDLLGSLWTCFCRMLDGCWYTDLNAVQCGRVIHLMSTVSPHFCTRTLLKLPTRYRVMNCSIEGTSSPTNLSIVLYWDNSRVHAGEYLYAQVLNKHLPLARPENSTHSAAVTESRT